MFEPLTLEVPLVIGELALPQPLISSVVSPGAATHRQAIENHQRIRAGLSLIFFFFDFFCILAHLPADDLDDLASDVLDEQEEVNEFEQVSMVDAGSLRLI